jgi:hypothetical protein
MSLTGDADFVAEIAQPFIRRQIIASLRLGDGPPQSPPFTVKGGAETPVALTVTDVAVTLTDDDKIMITLPFVDGAIGPPATVDPADYVACGLDGTIVVKTALTLQATGTRSPHVDIARAADPAAGGRPAGIEVTYTEPALQRLGAAFPGVPQDLFELVAETRMAAALMGLKPVALGGISHTPGTDGDLVAGRFAAVEIHTTPDRSAIAIYGNVMAADPLPDVRAHKTASALGPSEDVATAVSERAFHRQVFCPAVRAAAGSPLPTTCGNAASVDIWGLSASRIADELIADRLVVLVDAEAEVGDMATVKLRIGAAFALDFSGSSIVAQPRERSIAGEIEVWGGPLPYGAVMTVLEALAAELAKQLVDQAVDGLAGQLKASLPALASVAFDRISVRSDAVVLGGHAALAMPAVVPPTIALRTQAYVLNSLVTSLGVIEHPCDGKPFEFERRDEYLELVLSAEAVGWPSLILNWEVATVSQVPNTPWLPLPGASGTVVVPQATKWYGSGSFNGPVTIGYDATGSELHIRNDPADGNYRLLIRAHASSCSSTLHRTSGAVTWDCQGQVTQIREVVEYLRHWTDCVRRLWPALRDHALKVKLPKEFRPLPPHPPPWATPLTITTLRSVVPLVGEAPPADRLSALTYLEAALRDGREQLPPVARPSLSGSSLAPERK